MEVGREVRAQWHRPVLVQKRLEETRAGTGVQNDGQWEKQS